MSRVTSEVSKIISITTSDMPIYVVGDEELYKDIKRGWSNREVNEVPFEVTDILGRGLLIMSDKEFLVKY